MLDVTNASATYRLKCMGTHHCLPGVVVKVLPFYPVSIALVFYYQLHILTTSNGAFVPAAQWQILLFTCCKACLWMVFPQYGSLYVEFSYLIQGIQENQRLKWFYLQNGRHSSKSFSDVKSSPI